MGGGELYGGAGQVDLWELKGGQKVGHFTQNRVIQALAFSSEDRLLATGSWDDTARVWEIASGQELFRLLSPGGVVVSVELSPDDRWLSYGTDDHLVHISGWNPEDLIRSACKLIDYKFSDSEWGTYFPGQPYRFTCAP